ncbi:hypothetical protein SAMN04489798_2305 [Pseudomonas arsenicoxydans]|uniref:Uncharacterized protein n=1 Tax=Pseudomonas arsenicoxydans TaxID=702115 RepID=A0A1H0HLH6_9PSED|nr:hypothetical protein [Pseudomonas arsenicoxydans]SDO20068.1 hypothetical protein SAMN04489798_2305 [Pseudomonas arsenicoxydans]
MSNDLDTLSAGELQPYNPGQPLQDLQPLAPAPDTWGRTDLDEYTRPPQSQGQTLFGSALPAGASPSQVQSMLGQLGGVFLHDMSSLGYPAHMVQAALAFVNDHALKPPYQVTRNHNFELHGNNDYLGNAFGNMVQTLSGSLKAKQQFVDTCLQWLTKATAQLNKPDGGRVTAPRTAPNSSTEALLAQLSDADYAKVIKINEQARVQTMSTLEAKYGPYTAQNMVALAQAHLDKMTPAERQHFDQFTGNWVHAMNTPEIIEGLYNMAVGAGSIGTDGASIGQEIAAFEAMLKIPAERQKYMRDPQMQARLRELYSRRGS